MTDILPRRGDLDAQPFTRETWLKELESIFLPCPAEELFIVHPDEACRLRDEWSAEMRTIRDLELAEILTKREAAWQRVTATDTHLQEAQS